MPTSLTIPPQHREEVAALSKTAMHAHLRCSMAKARFDQAMERCAEDEALDLYDKWKDCSVEADEKQEQLWDVLKGLDPQIKSNPHNWRLGLDDITLHYSPRVNRG